MYEISTDHARLDLDTIHGFLSRDSYWAQEIPHELVERAIAHSLCFGVYLLDGGKGVESKTAADVQVGFARVVTDRATFAYVADVFILPAHRGLGLSKRLMEAVTTHPDLQNLRRWILATADAHGLYRQFGFAPLAKPDRMMERRDRIEYGSGRRKQADDTKHGGGTDG